jgi:hypothetical protein
MKRRLKTVGPVEPFAFTVEQFCAWYPSSRASVSSWIRSGELPSFKDRNKRLIPVDGARAFAKRKAAAGGAIPPEVSAQKSEAGKKGRAMQIEGDKAAA